MAVLATRQRVVKWSRGGFGYVTRLYIFPNLRCVKFARSKMRRTVCDLFLHVPGHGLWVKYGVMLRISISGFYSLDYADAGLK